MTDLTEAERIELEQIKRAYGGQLPMTIPVDHDPFQEPWYSKAAGGVKNFLQNLSAVEMAKGAYGAAKNMVTYPGDVLTGQRPYSTEGASHWAADTAGLLGARGLAMPSEGVGVFAGKAALNADHKALASKVLEGGAVPETVAEASRLPYQTGEWFKGPDGQWRFEIPDSRSRLTLDHFLDNARPGLTNTIGGTKMSGTLETLLDHPDLYNAYPYFKSMPITIRDDLPRGLHGQYSPLGMMELNATITPEAMQSTTLHELQHAIQQTERFGYGASDRLEQFQSARREHPDYKAWMQKNTQIQEAESKFGEAFRKHPLYKELMDQQRSIRAELDKIPYDLYHRAVGEAEARNVQTRWEHANPDSMLNKVAGIPGSLQAPSVPPTFLGRWSAFGGKAPHPLATMDVDPMKQLNFNWENQLFSPANPRFDIYGREIK